jgi:hypothetical protein
MTARELFTVIVRTIGLVWFLVGAIATVNGLISSAFSPVAYADPYGGHVKAIFTAVSGFAFLVSAKFVVRLICGRENSN